VTVLPNPGNSFREFLGFRGTEHPVRLELKDGDPTVVAAIREPHPKGFEKQIISLTKGQLFDFTLPMSAESATEDGDNGVSRPKTVTPFLQ